MNLPLTTGQIQLLNETQKQRNREEEENKKTLVD